MEAAVSSQLILYADDSAILVSGTDVKKIEEQLQNELSSLNEWLVDNRLLLPNRYLNINPRPKPFPR